MVVLPIISVVRVTLSSKTQTEHKDTTAGHVVSVESVCVDPAEKGLQALSALTHRDILGTCYTWWWRTGIWHKIKQTCTGTSCNFRILLMFFSVWTFISPWVTSYNTQDYCKYRFLFLYERSSFSLCAHILINCVYVATVLVLVLINTNSHPQEVINVHSKFHGGLSTIWQSCISQILLDDFTIYTLLCTEVLEYITTSCLTRYSIRASVCSSVNPTHQLSL